MEVAQVNVAFVALLLLGVAIVLAAIIVGVVFLFRRIIG